MALETVHVKFHRLGGAYDLTFEEQEAQTERSVLINGRQYVVLGGPAQLEFLREVIPYLSAEKNTPPGRLRADLSFCEGVEGLSVDSSLSRAELVERMESYLAQMMAEKNFCGSVLVKKGGERLVFQGCGVADARGARNRVGTRFCIGDVTKQFTAAAIMLLVQDGYLHLNAEINTVLPERFRNERWEGITVRHLLNHSSGIFSYGPSYLDDRRKSCFTLDEIIAQFSGIDLAFNPGEMFEYCNSNYALLGAIIEEISGLSYEAFMQERVFHHPAVSMEGTGMFSTYADALPATGVLLESEREPQSINPALVLIQLSKAFAGGAIVSTIEDMDRWDEALNGGSFLKPASLKEIVKTGEGRIVLDTAKYKYNLDDRQRVVQRAGVEYERAHYGFGVGVHGTGEVLVHDGRILGYSSFIARNSETKDCVVILSNQEFVDTSNENPPLCQDIAWRLWDMLSW